MSGEKIQRDQWWCILLIVAVGTLTRINTAWMAFASDDTNTIVSNAALHDLTYLANLFSAGMWPAGSSVEFTYRPLFMSLLAIEHALWGNNPTGYHLVGILLHIAASCLVFLSIRRIVKSTMPALAAGLFFSVHPVQTEVASWISASCGSLASVLIFSAFLCYLKYRQDHSFSALLASLFLYFCACFAKEDAYTFVAVVLLGEFLLFSEALRSRALLLAGYGTMAALAFAIRTHVIGSLAGDAMPAIQRLFTAPGVFLTYLKNIVYPFDLKVYYDIPVQGSMDFFKVLLPAAFLIGIGTTLVTFGLRKDRRILFAFGWIVSVMLPFSGILIFPRPALMADRYLYLAFFGISLLVALGLESVETLLATKYPQWKKHCVAACCFLLTGMILVSIHQSRVWANDESFYAAYLQSAPNNARAYNGMGANLYMRQDFREAARKFQRAVELESNYVDALFNWGKTLLKLGEEKEAALRFANVLRINPNFADAHLELGLLLMRQGNIGDAIPHFREAVRIDPRQPRYQSSLEAALRLYRGQERVD